MIPVPPLQQYFRMCAALACVMGCVHAWPEEAAAERAEERLSAAREAQAQFWEAQAAGDFSAAQQHSETTARLMREARELLEAAGAGTSRNPDALLTYARVLALHGDSDLAAEALQRAAVLAPDRPEIWLALAEALYALGAQREEDARRALERCIALDPAEEGVLATARARLGAIYFRAGLPELAQEAFEDGLEHVPGHYECLAGLAALHVSEGAMAEASARLEEVGFLGPFAMPLLEKGMRRFVESRGTVAPTFEAHFAHARILFQLNLLDRALAPLERALHIDPESYVARNFQGSVFLTLNRVAEAVEAFRESLALNPDQERTAQLLEQLEAAPDAPDVDLEETPLPID